MDKIAVFYASEGTGHRTAAENLAARFKADNPDGSVLCYDILNCVPRPLHAALSNYYLWTVKYWPALWGASYWSSDHAGVTKSCCDLGHKVLCKMFLPRAEKMVRRLGAQAVFFTHYFGGEYFAARNRDIPTFCVNTDFETHAFQRSHTFTANFCASETSVAQYAAENISPVFNTGIPVAPKFEKLPSKEAARAALGLKRDMPVILISGGGIGAGQIEQAADSIASRKNWQTVIICGNNKKLRKKLSQKYSGENIRIEGFVTNIEQYYSAADLGIIKPGGLTLAETLAAKLPCLLMSPVPGQEECNLRCVCKEKAAVELKDASHALAVAEHILAGADTLAELLENTARISRPNAAAEILKIAGQFL